MGIPAKLLIVFVFATLSQIAVVLAAHGVGGLGARNSWIVYAASFLGSAAGVFLTAGLIPVIVWAFKRFSREAANGVMVAWGALIALFAGFQYYGLAP